MTLRGLYGAGVIVFALAVLFMWGRNGSDH
jgi:hypothetical protein